MPTLNKVMLIGNLTKDPDHRTTPSGIPVVEFTLAVNRRFHKKDGEQGQAVLFIGVQAFGRGAEILGKTVRKGDPLFIEGHLQLEQWQSKDGTRQSRITAIVENFQFLRPKDGFWEPESTGEKET